MVVMAPLSQANRMAWCCVQTAAVTDWRAGFHLFGYNDKTPWNADSSRMLGLRTALSPRDLGPGDSAQIGLIPFSKGGLLVIMQVAICVIRNDGNGFLSCRHHDMRAASFVAAPGLIHCLVLKMWCSCGRQASVPGQGRVGMGAAGYHHCMELSTW
jgi:hypothetical protein